LGVGILTYELAIGRWRAALALAGSAAVVWVLIPSLGTRTAGNDVLGGMSAQYLAQANLSGRVLIWADVWNGMVSLGEPWGHGLGATAAYLANRYETIRHVHSEYLRLIAEAGVLGLALFLWSYVLLGAQLIRGRIAGQLPLAALALASIVMYLVACAAENMFEVFALYGIFPWIFMGLAFGSEDEGRQRGERTRSKEP
jgi:O-antigen ligase